MRLRLLSSLFILLAVAAGITLAHLPAATAQGDTPVAALTPTPVVMAMPGPVDNLLPPAPLANLDGSPVVMHLPFADTFTSEQGWFYGGQWRLDAQSGYDGTGWFLDGALRSTTSMLTYLPYIDLTGIFSTQLTYRQKGTLPETDLIAVDISLDGGTTWIMIDQQIGVEQDWAMHAVDLTEYRGQVIRLRFRVSTGQQLVFDQPQTGGYWIDDLHIQYATFSLAMMVPFL